MKIGFVSPYFDSTGGGERYVLTLASFLSRRHEVNIFWDKKEDVKRVAGMLNLKLPENCVVANCFSEKNFVTRYRLTRSYDLIFILSDGSIPVSFAKQTIIHFQAPFPKLPFSFWKKFFYHGVVVNSRFTKEGLDRRFGEDAVVIYPPVNVTGIKTGGKKQKIILSVGRFHPLKKQDLMIDAFLSDSRLPGQGYRLILAGSSRPQDNEYLEKLKMMARGKSIEILVDLSYDKLLNCYEEAEIYWHAAGLGETDPVNQEHFGIAPVEAMAAGAVPFVYRGGGLPEIVEDGVSGFTFGNEDELREKTIAYLNNPKIKERMSPDIRKKALSFDTQVFSDEFRKYLKQVTGYEI